MHLSTKSTLEGDLKVVSIKFCRLADELASAASLVQGQGDEGYPVVLIPGLEFPVDDQTARALLRPREEDMFR